MGMSSMYGMSRKAHGLYVGRGFSVIAREQSCGAMQSVVDASECFEGTTDDAEDRLKERL